MPTYIPYNPTGTPASLPSAATGNVTPGHIIEEEGVSLTQRAKLNFVGAGVTATDDAGDNATVVTIESKHMAVFSFEDTLIIGTGALRIYNHTGRALTVLGVYLAANTAPTTDAIIVDIHKNGTTIFTNQAHRPQIAAAANTGNTTTIDVATWADGEYLTCDLDQVGIAGATGRNLVVEVVVQ